MPLPAPDGRIPFPRCRCGINPTHRRIQTDQHPAMFEPAPDLFSRLPTPCIRVVVGAIMRQSLISLSPSCAPSLPFELSGVYARTSRRVNSKQSIIFRQHTRHTSRYRCVGFITRIILGIDEMKKYDLVPPSGNNFLNK
ncbi:hypothetical protein Dda3937_00624 [Dickeya dadantii 3937]|uniref:Uncharacterized protein n=1 Tax=Dickeya dadantii (strain 3937) TaxID=198628 RepID=E0SE75_DICD3|nr:hypothetical protein Dda3937_00624 [Dickeya dadantii 3937]